MIDQLALLFLFSADTCCSKEYSALGCQVLLIALLALRNARRTFQVSLSGKISLHVVPSEPPCSPSFDRSLVAFMAQAGSLTSVNSVSESLALAFMRSDVPLVSAPIRPLYSVLVAMLLSIITSISSFCSQSLAVAQVLSRL